MTDSLTSHQASGRLSFRAATLSNAAAIRALVVSAFRGESSREGWTTEADLFTDERISMAGVVSKIKQPHGQIIMVLGESDTLLGCAEIVSQAAVVHVGMLAVVPGCQGRGIGTALIEHLERVGAAEYAAERMEICVIWTRDDVIGFYLRRGFMKTNQMKPFPYTELVNGIALRDDLYFDVLIKKLLYH